MATEISKRSLAAIKANQTRKDKKFGPIETRVCACGAVGDHQWHHGRCMWVQA